MDSKFYIVFPSGEKTKLSVVELSDACNYEINDYDRASRREFTDEQICIVYAKSLAKQHGLKYNGDSDGFLD